MDGDSFNAIQSDDQFEASEETALDAAVHDLRTKLHTTMPGIIKSFDPDLQIAVVQPAIKRLFRRGQPVDLPPCLDVPVLFPGGGGFQLTFPVAAGDECKLSFSERAIDFWWEKGGVQPPAYFRFHDLSDAIAEVGLNSKPHALDHFNTTAIELRNRDGTTVLRVDPNAVTIDGGSGGGPAEAMLKAESFLGGLDTFLAGLDAFADVLIAQCTGVVTLPQVAAAVNAIGPAAEKLKPQIEAFKTALDTYKAAKGKVL
ncbi:MAG TPA: Gp138 family membrane-puncturing spike protein [Terriglobia bacterium]|nr:Gp138 family membrane-puncturing spike protein [Terriglobia bacterium]